MVGGVTVDHQGRTTVPGLWAAGEVSCTGLHGANRLASNSLLEGLVFGAQVGEGAQRAIEGWQDDYRALPLENPPLPAPLEPLDLTDIRNALTAIMWRNAGVRRDRVGLLEAQDSIEHWCSYVLNRQFTDTDGWQLQNMLCVARLVIAAALEREESRGVHLRVDFPKLDNEHWRRHLSFRRE
jgi:L-aspartate oxidase